MDLRWYLAMTAAEFRKNPDISAGMAWMACHFSPYGTGLSNCPAHLPPESMLILNDRTPVYGHDPMRIADQLLELTEQFGCSRVLLDLQRPADELTSQIVKTILQALPCPVSVSEAYAGDVDCPVFLPPIPLLQEPESYLIPWKHREVWLELAQDAACYTITEAGCQWAACPAFGPYPLEDAALCCRYRIEPTDHDLQFYLKRDTKRLVQTLENMSNITCLIGLYQELG